MIKIRILFLMLFLLVPAFAFAQTRTNADKSWQTFWTQFTAAVNRKNKAAVKGLMVAEKDFFSGGGDSTRDQWLQAVDENKRWGELQKSVRGGTKGSDNYDGKPSRTTRDERLFFVLTGGRWRFGGQSGD